MTSERVQRALELVETWNSGDVDAYLDGLGPGFEFTPDPSFPDSDTLRGEKLRAWLHEWIDTWEGNKLEVIEIDERGAGVLARCRWHLRASQDSIEVPAEDFTFAVFYDSEDRLRRLLAFFEHERAVAALGVVEEDDAGTEGV